MFSGCTRLREGAVHRNPWAEVVTEEIDEEERVHQKRRSLKWVITPRHRTRSHCRLSGLMDAVGYVEVLGDTGNESLFIQAKRPYVRGTVETSSEKQNTACCTTFPGM